MKSRMTSSSSLPSRTRGRPPQPHRHELSYSSRVVGVAYIPQVPSRGCYSSQVSMSHYQLRVHDHGRVRRSTCSTSRQLSKSASICPLHSSWTRPSTVVGPASTPRSRRRAQQSRPPQRPVSQSCRGGSECRPEPGRHTLLSRKREVGHVMRRNPAHRPPRVHVGGSRCPERCSSRVTRLGACPPGSLDLSDSAPVRPRDRTASCTGQASRRLGGRPRRTTRRALPVQAQLRPTGLGPRVPGQHEQRHAGASRS